MRDMENLLEIVNGDEKRLQALMGDLPERTSKPEQWNSAIEFWKERIQNYCRHNKKASFTTAEVCRHFQYGDHKLCCIPDITAELQRVGVVMDRLTLSGKFSWKYWTANHLLWTPISYGSKLVQSMKSFLPLYSTTSAYHKPQVSDSSVQFYFPELIDEYAKDLEPKYGAVDTFESLYSEGEFVAKYFTKVSCSETISFVIETWKSNKIIQCGVIKGEMIYKLGSEPVTENDLNMLEMKKSLRLFEDRISAHENEHELLMDQVQANLKSGKRNEAKRLLRQAKIKRGEIDKFKLAVDRLHETKSTIDSTALNAQCIGAIQSGNTVLKQYTGPETIKNVHDTVDEFEEQRTMADEINSMLSMPGNPQADEMAQLELELNGLLLSEIDKEPVLSSVPDAIPAVPGNRGKAANMVTDAVPAVPGNCDKPANLPQPELAS